MPLSAALFMIMFRLRYMTTTMVRSVHNDLFFIRRTDSNRNPAAAAEITSSFVTACVSPGSIPRNPSPSQIGVRTRGAFSLMPPANTSWSGSARHRPDSANLPSCPTPVGRLSPPDPQQDPAEIPKHCRSRNRSCTAHPPGRHRVARDGSLQPRCATRHRCGCARNPTPSRWRTWHRRGDQTTPVEHDWCVG